MPKQSNDVTNLVLSIRPECRSHQVWHRRKQEVHEHRLFNKLTVIIEWIVKKTLTSSQLPSP